MNKILFHARFYVFFFSALKCCRIGRPVACTFSRKQTHTRARVRWKTLLIAQHELCILSINQGPHTFGATKSQIHKTFSWSECNVQQNINWYFLFGAGVRSHWAVCVDGLWHLDAHQSHLNTYCSLFSLEVLCIKHRNVCFHRACVRSNEYKVASRHKSKAIAIEWSRYIVATANRSGQLAIDSRIIVSSVKTCSTMYVKCVGAKKMVKAMEKMILRRALVIITLLLHFVKLYH